MSLPALDPAPELGALHAEWSQLFLGDDYAARGEQTRRLAALVLAADLRTRVGDLMVSNAGWSKGRGDYADSVAEPGSDAWRAALGDHEHTTMTGDGRGADRQRWCQCSVHGLDPGPVPFGEWVRYEGWTAAGRDAHGFVHSVCRRILQTG